MKNTTKFDKTRARSGIGKTGQAAGDMTERAASVGRAAGERTSDVVQDMTDRVRNFGQEQSQRVQSIAMSNADGMAQLADRGREEIEVLLESSAIMTRGMQELGSETAKLSQQSIERVMAALNAGLQCRSLPDIWQVQLRLVRDSLALALENNARLSELSARVANDALRPFNGGQRAASGTGQAWKH